MRPAFAALAAGALCAINGDEESTAPAPARRTDPINSRREGRRCKCCFVSDFARPVKSLLLGLRIRLSPSRILNRQPHRVVDSGYPRQVALALSWFGTEHNIRRQ